jgi:hypothetical protein
MQRAVQLLPVEPSYAYHRALTEGPVHRLRRDPAARPAPDEMAVPAAGWEVQVHARSGTLVGAAADDLREYLAVSMRIRVTVRRAESLDDWAARTGVILAGTREHLPGIGTGLRGSKDYEIRVTADRVVVCGYDELGVMHGLFNLEARMSLRAVSSAAAPRISSSGPGSTSAARSSSFRTPARRWARTRRSRIPSSSTSRRHGS